MSGASSVLSTPITNSDDLFSALGNLLSDEDLSSVVASPQDPVTAVSNISSGTPIEANNDHEDQGDSLAERTDDVQDEPVRSQPVSVSTPAQLNVDVVEVGANNLTNESPKETASGLDFHVLAGGALGRTLDPNYETIAFELAAARRSSAEFAARKACSASKIVSELIVAALVYPGSDDLEKSDETVKKLLVDAQMAAGKIGAMMGLNPENRDYAGSYNIILQQTSSITAQNWRMQHTARAQVLDVNDVVKVYQAVFEAFKEGENPEHVNNPYPDLDDQVAESIALIELTQGMLAATGKFDYLHRDPFKTIVQPAVVAIRNAAHKAASHVLGEGAGVSPRADRMIRQNLIRQAGRTFTCCYERAALKDVTRLRAMDKTQRAKELAPLKRSDADGVWFELPVIHIHDDFNRVWERTIEHVVALSRVPALVVENDHELAKENAEIVSEPVVAQDSPLMSSAKQVVADLEAQQGAPRKNDRSDDSDMLMFG